jgi:DNA repair exonuclease SbcCD ATPase subunit
VLLASESDARFEKLKLRGSLRCYFDYCMTDVVSVWAQEEKGALEAQVAELQSREAELRRQHLPPLASQRDREAEAASLAAAAAEREAALEAEMAQLEAQRGQLSERQFELLQLARLQRTSTGRAMVKAKIAELGDEGASPGPSAGSSGTVASGRSRQRAASAVAAELTKQREKWAALESAAGAALEGQPAQSSTSTSVSTSPAPLSRGRLSQYEQH